MKRLISFLAMAALAAIAACKDATGPQSSKLQTNFSMVIGADTNYVLITANQPALWQLYYGLTAYTDTLKAGPSQTFSPTLKGLTPGTDYRCLATATAQGVSVSIDCGFSTPSVSLTITPASPSIQVGDSIHLSASFSAPLANARVVWTTTMGSIDSNGLITNLNAAGTATVKACSQAYPTLCNTATVTIQASGSLIAFLALSDTVTWSDERIWLQNVDGTGRHQLTTAPTLQDLEPVWFLDGNHLAFIRLLATGMHNICIIRRDGTDDHCINLGWIETQYPIVSPDGKRVAFQYMDEDSQFHVLDGGIAVADTNGTNLRRLTQQSYCFDQPTGWSPDGQWIALVRCGGGVWKMDTNGSQITKLHSGGAAVWSPDGTRIVFQDAVNSRGQVFVMNADGSNVIQLTNDPVGAVDPTWSPDGKKIAYAGGCCNFGTMDIYIRNADGSGTTKNLTNTPGAAERQPTWQP